MKYLFVLLTVFLLFSCGIKEGYIYRIERYSQLNEGEIINKIYKSSYVTTRVSVGVNGNTVVRPRVVPEKFYIELQYYDNICDREITEIKGSNSVDYSKYAVGDYYYEEPNKIYYTVYIRRLNDEGVYDYGSKNVYKTYFLELGNYIYLEEVE